MNNKEKELKNKIVRRLLGVKEGQKLNIDLGIENMIYAAYTMGVTDEAKEQMNKTLCNNEKDK